MNNVVPLIDPDAIGRAIAASGALSEAPSYVRITVAHELLLRIDAAKATEDRLQRVAHREWTPAEGAAYDAAQIEMDDCRAELAALVQSRIGVTIDALAGAL